MLEWIQHWLAQNWLPGAAAVAAFILEWFFKPLRSWIPKFWSLLSRLFKRPRITLRFVAMPWPRHWATSSWNNQPFMSIVTVWSVTNVPRSGIPAQVLTARPLKPLAKDFMEADVMEDREPSPWGVTIPEGETRALEFSANSQKFLSQKVATGTLYGRGSASKQAQIASDCRSASTPVRGSSRENENSCRCAANVDPPVHVEHAELVKVP